MSLDPTGHNFSRELVIEIRDHAEAIRVDKFVRNYGFSPVAYLDTSLVRLRALTDKADDVTCLCLFLDSMGAIWSVRRFQHPDTVPLKASDILLNPEIFALLL